LAGLKGKDVDKAHGLLHMVGMGGKNQIIPFGGIKT